MTGTYLLCAIIILAFLFFPEDTVLVFTTVSLKIQVYVLNWKMKRQAKALHNQLCKDMKNWGVQPPPFKWVDLWDREPKQ